MGGDGGRHLAESPGLGPARGGARRYLRNWKSRAQIRLAVQAWPAGSAAPRDIQKLTTCPGTHASSSISRHKWTPVWLPGSPDKARADRRPR